MLKLFYKQCNNIHMRDKDINELKKLIKSLISSCGGTLEQNNEYINYIKLKHQDEIFTTIENFIDDVTLEFGKFAIKHSQYFDEIKPTIIDA
jgi:hypothetical protein